MRSRLIVPRTAVTFAASNSRQPSYERGNSSKEMAFPKMNEFDFGMKATDSRFTDDDILGKTELESVE